MKKLLVTACLLTATTFSFAAQNNNNNNNQKLPNPLEGYYVNLGLGIASNSQYNHNNFSFLGGFGYLQPASSGPVPFVWGVEGNLQFFGDSIYGLNINGTLGYQFSPMVSAYVKTGPLFGHNDKIKVAWQLGGGIGYMLLPNVRTTLEYVHTFGVADSINSYTVGMQYLLN